LIVEYPTLEAVNSKIAQNGHVTFSLSQVMKVAIFMSDRGQDPTEVVAPWKMLSEAHVDIDFVTETGTIPAADPRLLEGWTQKWLGATRENVILYRKMAITESFATPRAWSHADFNVTEYDGILLPGGHDKAMRQYLESESLHRHLVQYAKLIERGKGHKVMAAIYHGVLVCARAISPDGQSILHDLETTTLPDWMENVAYYSTALVIGDYYKTYSKMCADEVRHALRDSGRQYMRGPTSSQPFFHIDPNHYFLTARYSGDAQVFALQFLKLLRQARI